MHVELSGTAIKNARLTRFTWSTWRRSTNMVTRKTKGKGRREASRYLETIIGGPLTLGAALSGLREADERSLAEFAKLLGVSRSHLCDIEQGRRAVSPERAARFAQALDQSEAQFVRLALQDQIRGAGLRLTVEVKAA
jgi:plasmid maintenance system antidote protein VapI